MFVQSSGDHGIIVFSLGSMIGNLTMERANTIASALGQIPQKVCNFLSFYSNRTAAFWKKKKSVILSVGISIPKTKRYKTVYLMSDFVFLCLKCSAVCACSPVELC